MQVVVLLAELGAGLDDGLVVGRVVHYAPTIPFLLRRRLLGLDVVHRDVRI